MILITLVITWPWLIPPRKVEECDVHLTPWTIPWSKTSLIHSCTSKLGTSPLNEIENENQYYIQFSPYIHYTHDFLLLLFCLCSSKYIALFKFWLQHLWYYHTREVRLLLSHIPPTDLQTLQLYGFRVPSIRLN